MKKCIKCGSHAFNLYAEEIDQGGLCDVHYWQGRAHRAEALLEQEPEVVSKAKFNRLQDDYNDLFNRALQDAKHAKAWRAHVNNCQLQGVDLDHVFKLPLTVQPAQEPLEYWNAVEGWVKIDEVREHFDSVGCGTIYKTAGEDRVPVYTALPKQEPHNFCPRCGKRAQGVLGQPQVHTCTPPLWGYK